MKLRYQRIMTVYYKGDPNESFVKKTSFASKEAAAEDLKKIVLKQTGTNEDNWEIVDAEIVDRETNETVWLIKKVEVIK